MTEKQKQHSRPYAKLRLAAKLGFFALFVIGAIWHTNWGTYSSFGFDYIASVCPIGALETMFGTFSFISRLLLAFAVACIVILVVGKAFCAWVCPVPPIEAFLRTKKQKHDEQQQCALAGAHSLELYKNADKQTTQHVKRGIQLDSRHAVLCGALGSAAIFGFPVFCLVCPIGLTCATVIAFVRMVGFNEPSWGLLIFPLIVVLELTLLKNFCSKICPIAALMSLLGHFAKGFRPKVDATACLRHTKGEACHACASACPIHIDPHSNLGELSMDECIRCGRCVQACPTSAVSFLGQGHMRGKEGEILQ